MNVDFSYGLEEFLKQTFFYHADFISFIGKSYSDGKINYFGKPLNETMDNNNFYQYFGTASFSVNGMQAFGVVIITGIGLLVFRLILWYYNRKEERDEKIYVFSGNMSNHVLWPWLLRFAYFFFQLITTAGLLQMKYVNIPAGSNTFLAAASLIFYAGFSLYILKYVLNSEDVYLDEETCGMNDPLFYCVRTEETLRRNHYGFLYLKKLFLSIVLVSTIKTPESGLTLLLIVFAVDFLRIVLRNPFKEKSVFFIYLITEVFVLIEILLFLLLSKNDNEIKKSLIIPDALLSKQTSLGTAISSVALLIAILHFLVAFVLFCAYFLKHIDCLCALFSGSALNLRDPAEDMDSKLEHKVMMELESSTKRR